METILIILLVIETFAVFYLYNNFKDKKTIEKKKYNELIEKKKYNELIEKKKYNELIEKIKKEYNDLFFSKKGFIENKMTQYNINNSKKTEINYVTRVFIKTTNEYEKYVDFEIEKIEIIKCDDYNKLNKKSVFNYIEKVLPKTLEKHKITWLKEKKELNEYRKMKMKRIMNLIVQEEKKIINK